MSKKCRSSLLILKETQNNWLSLAFRVSDELFQARKLMVYGYEVAQIKIVIITVLSWGTETDVIVGVNIPHFLDSLNKLSIFHGQSLRFTKSETVMLFNYRI